MTSNIIHLIGQNIEKILGMVLLAVVAEGDVLRVSL